MMLTVSMTVSHFYQNSKNIQRLEALNRLLKVLIIAINAQSHSVDAPPRWFGGGDHLCPSGRKLIDAPSSLFIVGMFNLIHMLSLIHCLNLSLSCSIISLASQFIIYHCSDRNLVCYRWFIVFIGRSSAGGSCEISVRDLFCFLSVFCDPGFQLSPCFTDRYLPFRIGCMEFCTPLQPFFASQLCPLGELKPVWGWFEV